MADERKKVGILVLSLSVAAITAANYLAYPKYGFTHFFLQRLFFIPLILSGFWFGLLGAIIASVTITLLNFPYVLGQLRSFTPNEFNHIMQMIVFNVVAACLGLLRDRERREQERAREVERLAAMGGAMSSVAHDMKTPLIAIGGFACAVQKTIPAEDARHQKLGIVITETRRLEKLVEDMLDFSKPMELHRAEHDFSEIVKESFSLVEAAAEAKKVRLEAPLTPDSAKAYVDPLRMKQALINLVMNGIQASPEGATVEVRSYRKDSKFIIEVTDRGYGIPPERKDEVFMPFVTTKKEGTGLGLPIVKRIVEAHQGRISILDGAQGGVTIRMALPLK